MRKHFFVCVPFVLAVAAIASADEQRPATTTPSIPASAPAPFLGRVFVDVNGGYQSNTLSFNDRRDDPFFAETATWTADYSVKNGPSFDAAIGVRTWKHLVARVGFSRFTDTRAAAVVGSVPHPFFFNRDRAISGESPGLKQEEQAVHVSALWLAPVNDRFEVAAFGGPSIFQVKRDLVEDVRYSENYPYDTAAFDSATVKSVKDSPIGFHAGADVTYFVTRNLGVGAVVRFTRARVDLPSPATGGSVQFDAGGLQAGAGLRLRFGGATSRSAAPREPRRPSPGVHGQQPPTGPPAPQSPADASSDTLAGQGPKTTALIRSDAPVFIRPEAVGTPLQMLPRGTQVRVQDIRGDWLMIEFRDARWGTRVGWLQRKLTDW